METNVNVLKLFNIWLVMENETGGDDGDIYELFLLVFPGTGRLFLCLFQLDPWCQTKFSLA